MVKKLKKNSLKPNYDLLYDKSTSGGSDINYSFQAEQVRDGVANHPSIKIIRSDWVAFLARRQHNFGAQEMHAWGS